MEVYPIRSLTYISMALCLGRFPASPWAMRWWVWWRKLVPL